MQFPGTHPSSFAPIFGECRFLAHPSFYRHSTFFLYFSPLRSIIATIENLQRVITYGGANITVADLVHRYQARLNHLRQLDAAVATAGAPLAATKRVAPAEQFILSPQEAIDVKLPGTATEQAATVPVGARVEESGGGRHPGDGVQALYGRPLVPPDGGRPGTEQAIVTPSPETRRAPQRVFSWRSFFDEQGITILASIGAILILVGSLSFIVTTPNILLAFLVVFIVHALFGIGSAIAYRFASLRLVARIYSGIFALQSGARKPRSPLYANIDRPGRCLRRHCLQRAGGFAALRALRLPGYDVPGDR